VSQVIVGFQRCPPGRHDLMLIVDVECCDHSRTPTDYYFQHYAPILLLSILITWWFHGSQVLGGVLWVRVVSFVMLVAMLFGQIVPASSHLDGRAADGQSHEFSRDDSPPVCGGPSSHVPSCDGDNDELPCSSSCIALIPSGPAHLLMASDTHAADPLLLTSTLGVRPPHPPPKA